MRTIYPDANALAAFAKVAELGNFRAAARALALSKSTVSARIAALEEHLGTRLLERTTRAVRMTEAGRTYHRHASLALDALQDGVRAMEGLRTEPGGCLRATAPLDFDAGLLSRLLSEYRRRLPAVRLVIDLTDRRLNVVEEGIDLALREGPLEDSSLVARKLGTPQRLLTYASPDYLRRRGLPKQPRELASHECLVMGGHQEPGTWRFRLGRQTLLVDVQPGLTINSFNVLRELAIAGHGIARLPERRASVAVAEGRLQSILDAYAPPARALQALYPSGPRIAPKLAIFLDVLEELLESN
jgi:DNA-binding transcriptional LysR family regulator